MITCKPKYSKTEFAQRGDLIYENNIRLQVESNHSGIFVTIDIETGAWELDADDHQATQKLLQRVPEAQMWLKRVGHRAAYRIGGSRGTIEKK